jgi:hypothetical protein
MLAPDHKLKEYDSVKVRGCTGVVLLVHDVNPPAYEVELFDENNEHLWWGLVRQDEIESLG